MIDISSKDALLALPPEGRKKDKNIGIFIDERGRLLLYKSGRHRLALAQLLNIDCIPVHLRAISGEYLKGFVNDVDRLNTTNLLAALRAATDELRP